MEFFIPKKPPAIKQFYSSAWFQMALIFCIVFSATFYIRKKQREDLQSRVEYLKSGPTIVEKSQQNESGSNTQVAASEPATAPAVAVTAAAPAGLSGVRESVPSASVGSGNAPTTSARTAGSGYADGNEKNKPLKLKVLYTELDQGTLNYLKEESMKTGQFTQFDGFMGVITDLNKKLATRNIKTLQKMERKIEPGRTNLQWYIDNKSNDENQYMGLAHSVTFSESRDIVKGEIEIMRSFRETNESGIIKKSIQSNFELNKTQGFMLVGVLPHRVYLSEEDFLGTEDLFKIFQSPDFKASKTEFTIFLTFEPDGAE